MLIARLIPLLLAAQTSAPASRPASPLSEREGAPLVAWHEAERYLGHECTVQGQIVATKNVGNLCFLNFQREEPFGFTIIVRSRNFGNFKGPPEAAYRDRWIRAFGTISEYRGKPQMEVRAPEQIEILPGPVALPPTASRPAASAPASPARLRIATYNVLNLFDGEDDPYTEDEGTPPKPRGELERLAATIRRLNADVLALQEVENRPYLERFVRVLLPDMGYREIVLVEGNDARGIDCAVLSRFPVGPVTSHRHLAFAGPEGDTTKLRRDLLEVRIMLPGRPAFDVFVVHLKSNRSDPAANELRLAEARAIRRVLEQRLIASPEARFVICGDFNDVWESGPLRTIVGSGTTALCCFSEELPADRCISYNKAPFRSMIDFILCSPAMARTHVAGSYEIVPGTVESSGSDHNPVLAAFKIE